MASMRAILEEHGKEERYALAAAVEPHAAAQAVDMFEGVVE